MAQHGKTALVASEAVGSAVVIQDKTGFEDCTHRPAKTLSKHACLVSKALADTEWDFRTIEGIMRSSRLSQQQVEQALNELGHEVRTLPITKDGNKLYTLRKRKGTLREHLAVLWFFLRKAS